MNKNHMSPRHGRPHRADPAIDACDPRGGKDQARSMLHRLIKSPSLAFSGASDIDAYQKALIHSTRVRKLKIWLPVAAGVISLAFIAVSVARAYLTDNIPLENTHIEDGQIPLEPNPTAEAKNKT